MAKIGEVNHLPDIKARKCEQCHGWFFYDRITKKYCGNGCRQNAKRGVQQIDNNPHLLSEYEQLSARISIDRPDAFERLEKLKVKYGFRSVEMCLDVIIALMI